MTGISDQWHYLKYAVYSVIITFLLGSLLPWSSLFVHNALGVGEDKVVGIGILYFMVLSSTYVASTWRHAQLSPHGKAVLITGCDSGFGLNAALHLDKIGMHVFAACHRDIRTAEGAKKLQSEGSERMKVLQLEVTSDEDVQKALEFVTKNLPSGVKGLWGLVNNAGKSTFGEVEFCPMETYEKIIDINLHGSIRVTKEFLPLIRRAKGRVVFVSSTLGRVTSPLRSAYSMSKFAMESFAMTLSYEMNRWGVKVSIVEPSNFIAATNLYTKDLIADICNEMWEKAPQQVKDDYGKQTIERAHSIMRSFTQMGSTDATLVINDFQRALLERYPNKFYKSMDLYWWTRTLIMTQLPSAVGEYLYIPKEAPVQ